MEREILRFDPRKANGSVQLAIRSSKRYEIERFEFRYGRWLQPVQRSDELQLEGMVKYPGQRDKLIYCKTGTLSPRKLNVPSVSVE